MRGMTSPRRIIPPILGLVMTLMILLVIHRDYPLVGHDYRYFISRLIDTNIHIQLNGLSIQWYTPSFGGGLPAFPNPQHLEYSLVQWVSFWIGPWPAILLTTAVISWAGFYFCYKLLTEEFELDWKAGSLGAMFFLGNGFFIEHMIVGQLGYQLFPLGAGILYFLLNSRNRWFINAVAIALVIAMMIYQAGFYLIIILTLSFAVTLPIIYLYRPMLFHWKRILQTLSISALFCGLLASAKLNAVFALMSHFPRQIFDSYTVGTLQALIGLIAQFLGVMVLAPLLMITGQNTDLLSGALSSLTGAVYGIWEIDTGLSPVLIGFLLLGIARMFSTFRARDKTKMERSQIFAVFCMICATWLIVELTFARGPIYSLIRDFPILRSLHVNVRFASAFILPLVVVGAFLIDRFLSEHPRSNLFPVASLFTIVTFLPYFFLSGGLHSREFNVPTQEEIQSVKIFDVRQISDIPDWDVFEEHASSYQPYEPLFGYSLETFKPMIHPGSVLEEDNGYFNMTNPSSLVFPAINNTYPFERIRTDEREKLDAFTRYQQPDWNIPGLQKLFNILSILTLVLSLFLVLFEPVKKLLSK